MGQRVTIQDIADALGLSRNTVSKALNNGDGLAESTRERIIQKAMEMGYKQFAYAKLFSSPQNPKAPLSALEEEPAREIALFSASFLGGSHFASLMLDAFQNEISRLGYTLSMHRVSDEQLAYKQIPSTFRPERVAAITCFEMFDYDYDLMLCRLGLPILFVDGPARVGGRALPADMLSMDNCMGVSQLVMAMLAAGVRRIGFLGNQWHCNSFYERYAAFRLAMLLGGHDVEERFCIAENKKAKLLARLAQLDELPELFVCANDFVALDALQALRDLGYDVPRDVMLAGFDDSGESRASMPALTTVHIHTQVMAYSAVAMLQARMREPNLDYRTVYTETGLIYRASAPLPTTKGE